jgi:hypothetical protein
MSVILTLLFVCDKANGGSPFLVPLREAELRLLVGHHTEDAKTMLAGEPIDAIVVDPDHLQDSHGVMAELKHVAPRTPVIVLRRKNRDRVIKPPGVAAVCTADPADKKVLSTIPAFLGLILGKQKVSVGGTLRFDSPYQCLNRVE